MGSAVSSADQQGGRPQPPIKSAAALGAAQFHCSLLEYKMTIACDIPTQMIVDDSLSSSSSSPETSNLAEVMKARRRKKKKRSPMVGNTFSDLYKLTGQSLGEGSYGKVETCVNVFTGIEYAVKIIEKVPGLFSRSKMLKEIEIYHLCRGEPNIIQLIEYFEEANCFYLVFEKMLGGPLLDHIQRRVCFTEAEASRIVQDLAGALKHLHKQGIAHRDLKPDNVLCMNSNSPGPVKLCDFDLCSAPVSIDTTITPTLLSPVGSLEYMAPEVVDTFLIDDFASRAMAVNRAMGNSSITERSNPIQVKRAAFSFDLSPPSLSNCGLMARRRRSKELFQRFCSIDEVEPDAFMRTIH